MRLLALSLFVVLSLSCKFVSAQSLVQLYDEELPTNLSDFYTFFEEEEGELTIDQILSKDQQFIWRTKNNPNLGFHKNGIWLLNRISNVSNLERWAFQVNYAQLDEVDFYIVVNGRIIAQSQQGKMRFEQIYRRPTFVTSLPFAQPFDLYVRVKGQSTNLIVPLTARPATTFSSDIQVDNLMWGVFYGGLIILAIYNLVLFIGSKEISLISYVCYVTSVLIWQYIWGGHVQVFHFFDFSYWLMQRTEITFSLIGLSAGWFTYVFLDIRKNAPISANFVYTLVVVQLIISLFGALDILSDLFDHNFVYSVAIVTILSYMMAGFEAYANNFKPARYFIYAWSILSAGAIIGLLSLLDILPSNGFTGYCFQAGVFAEAVLFSFALMEKSRSELESEIDTATTELRSNMEYIEEQNVRLDIARKDAINASNVKSQFLANMSHEIRTPLNVILGFSQELNKGSLPAEKLEQVRNINTAADSLLSIVNNVLDFSKIEAGKLQINSQPFSPHQLFEEMVNMMSKTAHMKGLEFIFELEPLPEKLIGDIFRIKQVLNNLLGNGLKFTSKGYIALRIGGTKLSHGIYELRIVIEDTGIGISDKDKQKLFTAFSQVDDALNRQYQGTGLGLVICQELIRLMRGSMKLISTPGIGSIFTITVPTNLLSQRDSLLVSNEWENKSIVLFDQIAETRRASAKLLHHLGAKTTSVESIEFLKTLDFIPDYLFVSLPIAHSANRLSILSELIKFKAKKSILWYSGVEPFSQYPSISQYFNAQLRLPITPWRLEGLSSTASDNANTPSLNKLSDIPNINILAVDDMEMNLKLLSTWLGQSKAKLTLSTSGKHAVELCKKHEYDLILMDVQMPEMDGLQATRKIRQTKLNMGTPIIAVTAHAFKEEQKKLLDSGMDDHLPKPIDVQSLVRIVREWCCSSDNSQPPTPTLDWGLAIKRTNGNELSATELMQDFITMLPTSMDIIEQKWLNEEYEKLQKEIHRLHGASCYTGAPKLQTIANELEGVLKRGEYHLTSTLMEAIMAEAKLFCSEGKHFLENISR